MKRYIVNYNYGVYDRDKEIEVDAQNAPEAYDKAVYDVLPVIPYSAFVAGYIKKDGTFHRFNHTMHGFAY